MSQEEIKTIDMVYFDGCPNVDTARANLRAVLAGRTWREWDLTAEDTPKEFRRYDSPTVLINGRDVTGEGGTSGAMACRKDGAPSQEAIRKALVQRG